jgi:phosphoribosyl 1,2-cyclic phosphodiesterase
MNITFWGTRGSLPAALDAKAVRRKIVGALVKASGRRLDDAAAAEAFCDDALSFAERGAFGGATSCVQLDTGGPEYLLCDLGTGAREFAVAALARHGPAAPQVYNILLSHVHWDHVMGFPFFVPAYIPGNRIRIHSCHPAFEPAIRAQLHAPGFPVEFSALGAAIEFIPLEPGRPYQIAGARVTGMLQHHGGDSYAYRLEHAGRSVIYATDAEYKMEDTRGLERTAAFFRDADLVIFDAMYSLADAFSAKEDWGHSSNMIGVELCRAAGAKRLCLFHHEPANDDEAIEAMFNETVRLEAITRQGAPLAICAAYDGLVLEL